MSDSAKKKGKLEKVEWFRDVRKAELPLPAWLDPANAKLQDPVATSLRPPLVPGGLSREPRSDLFGDKKEDGFLEARAMSDDWTPSGAPSDAGSMGWLEAVAKIAEADAGRDRAANDVTPQREEPKKPDTLIDELNPRADEEAVAAIGEAVSQLAAERDRLLKHAEPQLVQLAVRIAERVLAKELTTSPAVVSHLVREGLGALASADRVVIRVGPFFAEVIEQIRVVVEASGMSSDIAVDLSVGTYGCRIETQWGAVDESIDARLKAILESLSIYPPARA